jgi:uncharacterized RDD family membrane protein YckC
MVDPPQPQAPLSGSKSSSGPRAGFGARLGAALLDGILVSLVVNGLALALGQDLWTVTRDPGNFEIKFQAAGWYTFVAFGLPLVYYSYLEGSESGQTLGKKAVGIRVRDFAGGGPIGFGRGFLRWIARFASGIVCGLGYFWMLWDPEKQTWHDKIATTVVVPAD